jgi:hypothetical protein
VRAAEFLILFSRPQGIELREDNTPELREDGTYELRETGGLTLPSGALGIWYTEQYVASPRPHIPNSLGSISTPANLFPPGRRLLANAEWWRQSNVTLTDDAVADPLGATEAATSVGTGNWYVGVASLGYNLPAGTYTVAVNAKRNTGSDQDFAFSADNGVTRSSVKTATSAWQRFSFTFTLAISTLMSKVLLCSKDGVADSNLQIVDFELYSGSVDLGPQACGGQLILGANAYDTRPSYSSAVLDLTANGYGIIQLPSAVTATTFTAQAVISKTADGSTDQAFLSKVQDSSVSAFSELNAVPTSIKSGGFNVALAEGQFQLAGLWPLKNNGFHLLTHRYDGVKQELFLDDIRLFVRKVSLSPVSLRDLFVNIVNHTSLFGGLKYFGIGLWDRSLSDLEIRQSFAVWKARAAPNAVVLSGDTANRIYAVEGDSISCTSALAYPYVYGANANPIVYGSNFAQSGNGLANLIDREPYLDAIIPPAKNGRKFILSILIGANDLSQQAGTDAVAAANWSAKLATYCDARRAAGWLVVLCTILPIINPAGAVHNARRAIVNPTILSWVGVHCDAVADFTVTTMGPDAAASDVSLFYDGVHPSTAGHAILEAVTRPLINAL